MYYKFRDLRNYKYLLDIILNQRLYSASFKNLNDNHEGQFFHDFSTEIKKFRLIPTKPKHLSICSFSKNYKNHLMWSHYADGHRGIVIGFQIDQSKYLIDKINYDGLANFENIPRGFDQEKSVFVKKRTRIGVTKKNIVSSQKSKILLILK